MPKGTSRAEVTSNSEKIKPVALGLAVIELRWSEGIRQLAIVVSQSFSRKFRGNSVSGRSEGLQRIAESLKYRKLPET